MANTGLLHLSDGQKFRMNANLALCLLYVYKQSYDNT